MSKAVSTSPMRLSRFKALQRLRDISQAVGLIQDVRTRWNSTFEMLLRARRLSSTIEEFCVYDKKLMPLLLTKDEWRQIDQGIYFLKPFSDYTKEISSSKNATIHNTFFVYDDIFDHIAKHLARL